MLDLCRSQVEVENRISAAINCQALTNCKILFSQLNFIGLIFFSFFKSIANIITLERWNAKRDMLWYRIKNFVIILVFKNDFDCRESLDEKKISILDSFNTESTTRRVIKKILLEETERRKKIIVALARINKDISITQSTKHKASKSNCLKARTTCFDECLQSGVAGVDLNIILRVNFHITQSFFFVYLLIRLLCLDNCAFSISQSQLHRQHTAAVLYITCKIANLCSQKIYIDVVVDVVYNYMSIVTTPTH